MSESDVQVLTALLLDLKSDVAALNAKLDNMNARLIQAETDIRDLYQANSVVRLGEKKCQEEMDAKIDAIVSVTKPAVDAQLEKIKFWDKAKAFWGSLHISVKWAVFVAPFVFNWISGWLTVHGHGTAATVVNHVATYVATVVQTPTVTP